MVPRWKLMLMENGLLALVYCVVVMFNGYITGIGVH
jgi:hypothetical protein